MTPYDIKEYFVTWANAMRKAGFSNNAFVHWLRNDEVPFSAQKRFYKASKGHLKVTRDGVEIPPEEWD